MDNVYRVEGGIRTWTSGHHPHKQEPESWATASVYHFFHQLDRLAAEAVRRELFAYLNLPFPARTPPDNAFANGVLDSAIEIGGTSKSLTAFLRTKFVEPIAREVDQISKGERFSDGTPRSAIFFGPPGTSKTELSKKIAKFIGWPHLAIDPSALLRNGMDAIQAEANAIFRILEETERVVVLFDEFDEFMRERESSKAEQPFSRLLTTAMLPKLASIHRRGTLVFIIATNYVGQFDLAIRRKGRFDHRIQIMPPTFDAKMAKTDWGPMHDIDLEAKLKDLGIDLNEDDVRNRIADLTYLECNDFAVDLAQKSDKNDAMILLADRWKECTLQSKVIDEETWSSRCKAEAHLNQ